jgi:hypothetical protein
MLYSIQQALDHCLQPPHCGHADYLARPILGLPGQLRDLGKAIDTLRAWGESWRGLAINRQLTIEERDARDRDLLPLIGAIQDWRDAGEERTRAILEQDALDQSVVDSAIDADDLARAALATQINVLTQKGLL